VPLGVVITDSTSAASYISAFSLLKSILPEQSFGYHGHPSVSLTDDSDAERTALQTCWPDADLKLCLFHVPQAVWRWLWSDQHKIVKDDRKDLMSEFRRIVYCMNESEAAIAYEEAVNQKLLVNTHIISSTYNIGGNDDSCGVLHGEPSNTGVITQTTLLK